MNLATDSNICVRLQTFLICVLVCIIIIFAVAFHSPGSLSTDSGLQVFEAAAGRAMSWSPPFTSALIKWLGGGEIGTALIVVINTVLTYGCLGGVFIFFHANSSRGKWSWRILLSVLLILNPVIFFYVGIVWKDVLFSAALTLIVALTLIGNEATRRLRVAILMFALVLCSILPLIRQQGILIGPAFAICLSYLLSLTATSGRANKIIVFTSSFMLYVAFSMGAQHITTHAIEPQQFRDYKTGINETIRYDLAGTWQHSNHAIRVLEDTNFPKDDIARAYTGERIDTLNLNSNILNYFVVNPPKPGTWWLVVSQEPIAYLQHRAEVFSWLLGFHGVKRCLPLIAGVGLPPYLIEGTGIPNRLDDRNRAVLKFAEIIESLPIFRHWFYLIQLILTSIALFFLPQTRTRFTLAAGVMVCWIHLLSFVPVGIACDFRYLYPLLPLLALIDIAIFGIISINKNKEIPAH